MKAVDKGPIAASAYSLRGTMEPDPEDGLWMMQWRRLMWTNGDQWRSMGMNAGTMVINGPQ
jgi:hypothetical protein